MKSTFHRLHLIEFHGQATVRTSSLALLAPLIAALQPATPLVLIGGTKQLTSGVIL
jgi:hypothetical protein